MPFDLRKAGEDIQALIDSLDVEAIDEFIADAQDYLDTGSKEGGKAALAQLGLEDSRAIVELINADAVEYARERAAELVGKRVLDDGTIIDNPDAEYVISEATRDMLRATVADAEAEGASTEELMQQLIDGYAFSDERAETIARTEMMFADVQGNLTVYRASGQVEGKEWTVGDGCCDDCYDLDGIVVDLDADFPGDGGDGPPLHPNCRCDVLPVLSGDEDTDDSN